MDSTATHPPSATTPAAAGHDDAPSATRAAPRPALRTSVLGLILVLGSVGLLPLLDLGPARHGGLELSWPAIALISIAAEMMVFHVEFRREVYSFTFSEIPLVLGLLLASPSHLIAGRLIGEFIFLAVKERQSLQKLTLNLASFFGECVVLIGVYQLMGGNSTVDHPQAWIEALVAVSAADLLGFGVVALAVKWHGGPLRFRSILAIGALTAPVNTSLALVAGVLLTTNPWACLLLTGIAAFLVLSYRSYSALGQRFESLSLLYDFTRLVSGAQSPDVVLEAILVQAKDLLRAERAQIWLVDDRGGYLGLTVDDNGRTTRELPAETGDVIAAWFANGIDTTVVTRTTADARLRQMATALDADDCIVAPVTEAGQVVGLVAVVDRLGDMNGFRVQEGPMFATLANHASVALENGRLIVRLHVQAREREQESLHDALTGLPNRVLFGQRLHEVIQQLPQQGASVAIAVMDLDGFKEINDTLGHQSGDKVLVEVASRISHTVSQSVVVARLGGDEFALLFTDTVGRAEIELSAREVRAALALPMNIDGVRINVGISIGLAVGPVDGRDAATLLQRADVAMYGAKAGLGEGVNFYDVGNDTNTPRRLALANDLSAALASGELRLVYQPKVRLSDGQICGFESLARWSHPLYGQVGPDEFIPLAERTGIIHQLTEFVLGTALRHARQWQAQGVNGGVAVNLSMRNLLDTDLVRTVGRMLRESGLDPALLTLEITETNVMSDPVRTIFVLEQLAELGVHLSVDDFGTGYSSLSYLQRLPVDEVKIDKLFVLAMSTDPSAEAIVRSVLDLARNMNLSVVAEGVEDRETWDRLQALGCHEAQGFYLSRPMSAAAVPHCAARISELGLVPPADPGRLPAADAIRSLAVRAS